MAVNTIYPACVMARNRSGPILDACPSDALLSLTYGLLFFVPSVLLGEGMLRLGKTGRFRG